jgi:hypothetical protein
MDSKNASVIVVGRDGTEQNYAFDALLEGDSDGERMHFRIFART